MIPSFKNIRLVDDDIRNKTTNIADVIEAVRNIDKY
jgi:hypothetical protein